ncbi:MAG: accessory factor UbiK family protein [Paracoccaceae bacterium]
MQSRNQIIDDLTKLMTNAFGLAQNASTEIENAVKSLLDRYLADKGLVTREEFDVLKEIQSDLQKEILNLKKEINILKSKSRTTKTEIAKKNSKN